MSAAAIQFKVDRLSGLPLPEPLDKNNHLIDATRYALVNLIRNQPSGTFFSHKALLLDGEPVDSSEAQNCGPCRSSQRSVRAIGQEAQSV
jgi:hypothetical protein